MASVNVITSSQLDSIREKILPPKLTNKTTRLEVLHEQSLRRASHWPNTLKAERHRRGRARADRLAADETVQQKLDAKEAEKRAEKRRQVLERVNQVLFEQTDKVKGFQGAVLHADVLAERAAQIKFNKHIAELEKNREAAFLAERAVLLDRADDAEVEKLKAAKARALEQKDAQMQQLKDLKAGILAEREERRLEGEAIKRKAAKEEEAACAQEIANCKRAQDASEETKRANEILKEFKRMDAERERQADLAIEAYAAQQEAVKAERRKREAARQAAKEEQRKAMVQLMETKFKELAADEDERVKRNVQQAQEKQEMDAAEQQVQRAEEWAATCRSRDQQLAFKASCKKQALCEENDFVKAWQARTKELEEEEAEAHRAALQRRKHFANFQKHQVAVKQQKKDQDELATLQEAAMLERMAADTEDKFQAYAKGYIESYQQKGKPVDPMVLRLSKREPFISA